MLRKYENSKIVICKIESIECDSPDCLVIQTEHMGDYMLAEVIDRNDIDCLIPFGTFTGTRKEKPKQDTSKVAEYSAIVLNNDPLHVHSGETLGDIVRTADEKWIKRFLEFSKNTYITERLKYLLEAGGFDYER